MKLAPLAAAIFTACLLGPVSGNAQLSSNLQSKITRKKVFVRLCLSRNETQSRFREWQNKIYTGIGFDVPGSPPDDPETVYQTTKKAFGAGANGIVIFREYEEMRVANLKAVGRAVRS